MNLSSLYKEQFGKEELVSYTYSIVHLMERRLKDEISKKELESKLVQVINKFLTKYGR